MYDLCLHPLANRPMRYRVHLYKHLQELFVDIHTFLPALSQKEHLLLLVTLTMDVFAVDMEAVHLIDGTKAMARCAVVDFYGRPVLDLYIRPRTFVKNYVSRITGLTSQDLVCGIDASMARDLLKTLLDRPTTRMVCHDPTLEVDLLQFTPPNIVDTSSSRLLMGLAGVERPPKQRVALRILAQKLLGERIHAGTHCPVEDARMAMRLYRIIEEHNDLLRQ